MRKQGKLDMTGDVPERPEEFSAFHLCQCAKQEIVAHLSRITDPSVVIYPIREKMNVK